jgi:hypothetical protein
VCKEGKNVREWFFIYGQLGPLIGRVLALSQLKPTGSEHGHVIIDHMIIDHVIEPRSGEGKRETERVGKETPENA